MALHDAEKLQLIVGRSVEATEHEKLAVSVAENVAPIARAPIADNVELEVSAADAPVVTDPVEAIEADEVKAAVDPVATAQTEVRAAVSVAVKEAATAFVALALRVALDVALNETLMVASPLAGILTAVPPNQIPPLPEESETAPRLVQNAAI